VKIHEYQAKDILARYGVPVNPGEVADTPEEARAIADVFAGRRQAVPVVAAKGHFGHLGAAGGMVELIASVLALRHGHLFPVLNYETPDPECPVAAIRDASTPAGNCFINLSVTPQGQASGVLVRRWE